MRTSDNRFPILWAIGLAGLFLLGALAFSFRTAHAQMSNYVCEHHSPGCKMIQDCPGNPGPTDTYCVGTAPNSGNCMSVPHQTCTPSQGNCDTWAEHYCVSGLPVLNQQGQQVYCSGTYPTCM
jgi:hypothetical protein